ncbi:MAG: hypothetical protein V4658_13475, partial [Bacteroidota bacterium]
LFGFYTSDIRIMIEDFGISSLEKLTYSLEKSKLLTHRQSKQFKKAILKNSFAYPESLNKPCELLKNYYTNKRHKTINTILLPIEPMRPFKI